jgi:hypothetical protein
MNAAVFRTTGQALHFSFLIEAMPSTQKGATQIVIESLKRAHFVIEGSGLHTINVSGLSPIELRAQCAMVRGSVEHHLPQPEMMAVWARYGQGGRKECGVDFLSEYLAAVLPAIANDSAMRLLTASCFAKMPKGRPRQHGPQHWGLRRIGREFGYATATLHDARTKLREHTGALERVAETRLQALFERTGLVEVDEPVEVAA